MPLSTFTTPLLLKLHAWANWVIPALEALVIVPKLLIAPRVWERLLSIVKVALGWLLNVAAPTPPQHKFKSPAPDIVAVPKLLITLLSTASACPVMFSCAPGRMSVRPASSILPPDQLSALVTLMVRVPPNMPAVWVSTLIVEAVLAPTLSRLTCPAVRWTVGTLNVPLTTCDDPV